MIFRNAPRKLPRIRASRLSLALALACGMTLTATAIEAPAHAQKRKAKDEQAQAAFSDAFRTAFQPAAELFNASPRDGQAMRALVPSIAAAVSTPDDKLAGGQFIYAAGTAANDPALQLQGLSMMLESGKVPAANLGQYNFIAGQLAYQAKDFGAARNYLQAAVRAGYTENDPTLLLADTYLQQNDTAGALTYLGQAVDRQIAAGQAPNRDYLRKGLATAYNAQAGEQALRFAHLFAKHYPASDSWGDAIVVTRANTELNDDDTLDLLRLQRRTNTFRDGQEYLYLIELADPRRLPNEVAAVIEDGYASGLLARDNSFVSDALNTAKGRQGQLRADLAGLERDANASGAQLSTVMAAGNVFLDAGQPAKAEQFYQKALTLPGADTATVLTRLGIAQVNQGKHAEAAATFNQVQGARTAVARLWAIYAEQQPGGAATGS